ncbi:MAG: hypothetical protein ACE5KU_00195 [Nitrososphaerales archaeon]
MRKIIASLLASSILLTILAPIPLTSALSQIDVYTDKTVYVAGESVYVFGTIEEPAGGSVRVNITVANPSGGVWASVFVLPGSEGDFGATVGSISQIDSTGTYVVFVRYLALTNSTTFQVKTPQTITVETDKLVYLIDETITVFGSVSPLIEGYRVTLRIGTNESWVSVDQATPMSDGSYIFKDFYKVRSIDNGNWIVNATYGPLASATNSIYVGLRISLTSVKSEYLPGQLVNITGAVSPVVSGPVRVVVKNPSGGVWLDVDATPDDTGKFNVTEVVYPGDQVGSYSVSLSYWGVSKDTSFVVGRLGSSTLRISTLGIYDASGDPVLLLRPGSMVRVRATLINMDIVTHEFVFITQIKDSSGKLVFIGSQSSSVKPGGFVGQTVGQLFTDKDTYTVEVFVWDSWSNANSLSDIQTLTFRIA